MSINARRETTAPRRADTLAEMAAAVA